MTKSQQYAVKRLRRMIDNQMLIGQSFEVKEFRVEELKHGPVSVVCRVGATDENALLYCIFSDWFHIFIGKRGAAWYYKSNGISRHRWDWGSLYRVINDQKP